MANRTFRYRITLNRPSTPPPDKNNLRNEILYRPLGPRGFVYNTTTNTYGTKFGRTLWRRLQLRRYPWGGGRLESIGRLTIIGWGKRTAVSVSFRNGLDARGRLRESRFTAAVRTGPKANDRPSTSVGFPDG